LSDEAQREFREVQALFRLPSVGLVEKDVHVVRAIRAVMSVDAAPFALIFGGGTALARAHRLVRRMSEDVDFKIVLQPPVTISRNGLRRELGRLGDKVTQALQGAGFAFDPADKASLRSQNENRYTVWQLPYDSAGGAGQGLRPTIQIELTYSLLRLPPVTLPVSSFVAEAYSRPPEIPTLACVSVTQTAAEKLVALTRRTAMEMAGLSRDIDPALIRHVYDLHMMKDHIDPDQAVALAGEIARTDATEFRNQYPAYAEDLAGETRKALDALRTDPTHARRYGDFIAAMVYGEQTAYGDAMSTVTALAERGLV
jgi:predicted nucleotidyltransferase component of viral defense system